jgi:hypothetical protein
MFVHAAILCTRIKLGATYFFNSFARDQIVKVPALFMIKLFSSLKHPWNLGEPKCWFEPGT